MVAYATNLKQGTCIRVDGEPFVVVDSRVVKYGKGAAFVQVELRSALSGTPRQMQLHPAERLCEIELVMRRMCYRRSDGERHVFSDTETCEEATVPNDLVAADAEYLKEGALWDFFYLEGELFTALPSNRFEL